MIIVQLIPNGRKATDVIRLWYWFESIILWAFGIAWVVKGKAFLKD